MRILVVEDEPILRSGLVDLLKGAGHEVDAVGDGASAAEMGVTQSFDLVLLDLMLPKMDGMEVCQRLRTARPALSIIMLTARGGESEKVTGLKCGADDYVTKPFSAKELLARVEALGRRVRNTAQEPEQVEVDDCVLDLGRCQAQRGTNQIALTPREVGILRWLHRHRARAVTRQELLEHVWGVTGLLETRTVDMTMANLRQKIEVDASAPRIVVSVKGLGYAWGDGNGKARGKESR